MPRSSQTYSFQAGNQHVLNGARDTRIGNAVFNNVGRDQNYFTGNPLWEAIADVGASHNSEQQVDRGRCLPGTRKAVLKLIRQWRVSNCKSMPICWLSGTAGVGKSAIALTVAEECEKDGLVASFFFFRSDPKRNNPSSLILSITHGLVVTRPHLKPFVDQRIAVDPRILKARLEDQYKELILENLNHPPHQRVPDLVVIDGLDECSDAATQRRVLSIIFSTYQQPYHYPMRFLICSRPESWIRQEFSRFSDLTKHIELDDSFRPRYDIELYLNQQFQEIREDPSYSQVVFPNPWPSPHHVWLLVRKADGQFIFVITAMKFVKMEYTLPTDQLCIILNTISNPSSVSSIHSPFNDLDQLYLVVLRANPDRDKRLLPILAAITIVPNSSPAFIELLLGLSPGMVAQTLRATHSVLDVRGCENVIGIYHQSFTDFLVSQARSREFYIDLSMWKDSLACRWTRLLTKQCEDDPGLLRTIHLTYSSSLQKLVLCWNNDCLSRVGDISSALMSEVDAFYHVALSISAELVGHDRLLQILAAILLPSRGPCSPAFIQSLLGIRREDLDQALRAMNTIVHVDQQFDFQSISLVDSTHYTFRDFLFSRSRSKVFFIEKGYHSNFLALKYLRLLRMGVIPPSEDGVLFMKSWAHICTDVDIPSEELLFELYHMDLGGAFVKSPNCLRRLLCDFKMITTWLESKTNTTDLFDPFGSIQRRFHIRSTTHWQPGFPDDIIATIILSIVDWWQSPDPKSFACYPEGETIRVEWMMDCGMNYDQCQELHRLATITLRSAEFCRCSSSAFDSNCVSTLIPGTTDMYHVNIPAGCAQVFKKLVANLETHKTQDLTFMCRHLACQLLVKCPRLITKCLPLPELLPHFRMLLDFAKALGLGKSYHPREFETSGKKLLSWLEKFPPDCACEVEPLRNDLLSLILAYAT
ncbi:hypothetical protein E1B28_002827 [Marasmius oreades]|uniref:Nephrocystin 3-like N-terminal domain-containing protein n=1 Tax=Marasmius oreades TaxID=181124 RepID=A0A9P7RNH1_9AGAR|nr:uncharacterized protein E1B28_002827 [Marasmius oreades]KAG7086909.1 hypothetical protein E1B28_002827 [Marasmius oreades]